MTFKAQVSEIIVGAFYELPCGKIARTYGHTKTSEVLYYFDDNLGSRSEKDNVVAQSWKQRPDLTDFPNATDPRLPYVFDLFWDIKHDSELQAILADPLHEHHEEVRVMAKEHGLI